VVIFLLVALLQGISSKISNAPTKITENDVRASGLLDLLTGKQEQAQHVLSRQKRYAFCENCFEEENGAKCLAEKDGQYTCFYCKDKYGNDLYGIC